MTSVDEASNKDHLRSAGPRAGGANVEYGEYLTGMKLCRCSGTNIPLAIVQFPRLTSVIEYTVTMDCRDVHEHAIRRGIAWKPFLSGKGLRSRGPRSPFGVAMYGTWLHRSMSGLGGTGAHSHVAATDAP